MNNYILDTNIFFNMEAGLGLGNNTKEIAMNLNKIKNLNNSLTIEFFTAPSVVTEIESFFDSKEDPVLEVLINLLTVKSPSTSDMNLSCTIFESLITDYRERSYRGMKVAEEEIAETGKLFMGKEVLPHKEFQMAIGKKITTLRDRFRNATRTGTIDSQADLEVVLLSKELRAPLISTDEGVLKWGRKIGILEMSPSVFGKKMQDFL
jgi:RNA ligase partner protein